MRTTRLDLVSAVGQSNWGAVDITDWYETAHPVRHDFVAPRRLGPLVRTGPPIRIGTLRVWRMRAPHPVMITPEALAGLGMHGLLLTDSHGA